MPEQNDRFSTRWNAVRLTKKKVDNGAGAMLPPGLEPETFALPNTRNEVLVRRSNQLSYGSRSTVAVIRRC